MVEKKEKRNFMNNEKDGKEGKRQERRGVEKI